jgi:hypothetical protein
MVSRRTAVEGLARDWASLPRWVPDRGGPSRSTGVRKGSACEDWSSARPPAREKTGRFTGRKKLPELAILLANRKGGSVTGADFAID